MHQSFIYAAEDDVGDGDVRFGGSIQGTLAEAFAEGDTAGLATISGIIAGLHHYLGNFLGEFLSELSLNLFFLISASAMLSCRSGFSRVLGAFGTFAAGTVLIGAFHNAVEVVGLVAQLNSYLLPLGMIAFGIGLMRAREVRLAPPIATDPGRVAPAATP